MTFVQLNDQTVANETCLSHGLKKDPMCEGQQFRCTPPLPSSLPPDGGCLGGEPRDLAMDRGVNSHESPLSPSGLGSTILTREEAQVLPDLQGLSTGFTRYSFTKFQMSYPVH